MSISEKKLVPVIIEKSDYEVLKSAAQKEGRTVGGFVRYCCIAQAKKLLETK